jgi:hypothetical protein
MTTASLPENGVHYRPSVQQPTACRVVAAPHESITWTDHPAWVTCGACRSAMLQNALGGADPGDENDNLCTECREPLKGRDNATVCFACQQQAADV